MTQEQNALEKVIVAAWEARDSVNYGTKGEVRDAVEHTLAMLDSGALRVAEPEGDGSKPGEWHVNQWAKKAVLLSFRLNDMALIAHGPYAAANYEHPDKHSYWWDKVPSKFEGWGEPEFRKAGFRAVPGSYVRRSAYVAPNVILMPSFVNLGAYVDEGTMVDTWVTIGSCAQIGKHCHISGGVGIGGVLEPLQANPVIIEDNCFVGARSEIAEGAIAERGSMIYMGVYLGKSTKIMARATGEIFMDRVTSHSVVVAGSLPGKKPGDPSLYCAVIVKRVDERTRSKTSVNELLREVA